MPRWIVLSRVLWDMCLAFGRAAWFVRFQLFRDLGPGMNARLNTFQQQRVKHYYFGTTYLSVLFSYLIGRKRNRLELYLFSNMSALSAFFDDLSESPSGISVEFSDGFIKHPDGQGIAPALLSRVENALDLHQLPAFSRYLREVFAVESMQAESLEQAVIAERTRLKGGASVMVFRSLMEEPFSEQEAETIYAFGGLIQLCDDIFDQWFDRRAGIVTVPVLFLNKSRVADLGEYFEKEVSAVRNKIEVLLLPRARRRLLLGGMDCLVALTRTCLHRYRQQLKLCSHLDLENRKLMVTDMAKWTNRWIAMKYLVRCKT